MLFPKVSYAQMFRAYCSDMDRPDIVVVLAPSKEIDARLESAIELNAVSVIFTSELPVL